MPVDFDAYLGVHAQALKLYAQRTQLLANNLANADTPNYKARDLDFHSVLAGTGAASTVALLTTSNTHLSSTAPASAAPAALKYRVPLAPSLDGNTVDVQLEQAAFADNSVRYQAALTFLQDKFKSLMTAITGQ